MVQIGMLNLKGDQLFFRPLGKNAVERDAIRLEPGAEFEIQLGAVWIPGKLQAEYESSSDRIERLHFITREGNRCGLVPGMTARLLE